MLHKAAFNRLLGLSDVGLAIQAICDFVNRYHLSDFFYFSTDNQLYQAAAGGETVETDF